jgi:hypothetical protein
MAVKVSDLPGSDDFNGQEQVLVVQDGVSKVGSLSSLTPYLSSQLITYNKLDELSIDWEGTYTTVQASSGDWEYTKTYVQANSASWDADLNVVSEFQASSGDWEYTKTYVQDNSASWDTDTIYDDAPVTILQTASAEWDDTSSVVQTSSAQWAVDTDTIYDDSLLQTTSGNWNSSYTTVNANSASWDAHTAPYDDTPVTTLQSASAEWDNTSTAVQANSAQWGIDTDTVYDDSLLQSTSGNWDSVYTTVESVSSVWSSGSSAGTTLSSSAGNQPFLMITDSGGFVRGNNAVDLQLQRSTSAEGLSCVASGTRSALLGGFSNAATGDNSIVTGGTDNIASGAYSAVVGGNGNTAQGNSAEVLGGDHSIAMGTGSSTIGGNVLSAVGNYSAAVGGQGNIVKSGHNRSVILGGNGIESDASDTAYVPSLNVGAGFKMPTGAVATYVLTSDANGVGTWQAAAGGPAGPSGTILSGTTANATPTEIFVDGTSPNRVDVATGSTITFSALVAARSATESAGYKIEGVIKNDAGTAALVGVVAKTVFAEEDIAWDITVTAANNALTFIVTGDSADSVSWEVTLNKTEAT